MDFDPKQQREKLSELLRQNTAPSPQNRKFKRKERDPVSASSPSPMQKKPPLAVAVPQSSSALEVVSNPGGCKIFAPDWNLKENESILASSDESARKFVSACIPPPDHRVARTYTKDHLGLCLSKAIASTMVFANEAVERLQTCEVKERVQQGLRSRLYSALADKDKQIEGLKAELKRAEKAYSDRLKVVEEEWEARMKAAEKNFMLSSVDSFRVGWDDFKKKTLAKFPDLCSEEELDLRVGATRVSPKIEPN